ncbi:hypothetical protein BOTBODRAFT_33710 [Botryobasidium botryosum FD-172 SS1]|uniref:Domain of unknown function at the cortex 1 domain-containing protein n=1 Tax=Botryobasidium botryosum (strain FD-172 SS1) TaxID=930990 RepID=A0A067MFF5_BOTB1|nr:hypothetical protein BOTBODRAFT_33710 [Botryobasidium botryosum FD-172 SS1]
MPRLAVLAGPSPSQLIPITVNSDDWFPVTSERFDGRISVHLKGYVDDKGNAPQSEYFNISERKGVTWSIQVQGRFLQPMSADDVLFGNTFDRPLKLPWGSSAAIKFMEYMDPTIKHDLYGQRPWALSPLLATMPYLSHVTHPADSPLPPAPGPKKPLHDDITALVPSEYTHDTHPDTPSKRRAYFADTSHRRATHIEPSDVLTTDFCYGFISFPHLYLNLPGGISFDLVRYWDGQPVRFVCCKRSSQGAVPADDEMFWCVEIRMAPSEDEHESGDRGDEID